MSPRERLLATFEGRRTDAVPVFHAGWSSAAAGSVIGRRDAHVGGGIQRWREAVALWHGPDAHAEFLERCFQDAMDLTEALDCDLVRESYWRLNRRPSARIDERTFVYGGPDGDREVWRLDPPTELFECVERVPAARPMEVADLAAYVERCEAAAEAYEPSPSMFAEVLRARDYFGGQRAVRAGCVGLNIPYQQTEWLAFCALAPDLIARYLMTQAVHGERNAAAAAGVGIRILSGGGDCASSHGPFVSPAVYRRCWTPALRRVTAAAEAHGQFHKYASDGDLWPVADDLFAHVHGYFEIDGRAGMDLRRLRQRYPRLVVFGGVNSYTLHRGTPAAVTAEVDAAMDVARELGGVVVGCSNQVVAGTPTENIEAMRQAIDRRRYG